ncbi:riboflavin synthase alpha chain [Streptococcus pneumoniae GA13494]|nr:riboflavin synthase alpha chain [Streptococcus pneumoniae GA13494]
MNETWSRTALTLLKHGSEVNLERALSVNGRLGGHVVTGHIDGTGKISSIKKMIMLYGIKSTHKKKF